MTGRGHLGTGHDIRVGKDGGKNPGVAHTLTAESGARGGAGVEGVGGGGGGTESLCTQSVCLSVCE